MTTTILVVDDKPIFREPIEAVLRAEGFRTLMASNGQEAIAALSAGKPDLVLLDLGMPVMDGLSCLRHMRQDRLLSAIPVIVLSAEADRGRIVEAVKLGISGYVLKASFSLNDLLQRVKVQIGGARPQVADPSAMLASPSRTLRAPALPKPNVRENATTAGCTAVSPAPGSREGTAQPTELASSSDAASNVKTLKPILTRSEILERLKACEELKGFSPTVSQVLKLTASPDYSLDTVSRAVRQDQAMALKILKVANSSVYSRGDRVDTVHKAILRIGMESIRQVVLNIGVVERFSSPAFKDHVSTPQFWEHSIACGIIAAEIAHALDAKEADSAFTAGLLHDLGRVVFAEALGEQYSHVIETARRMQAPLELVETRMLLLNHADVMDRLLSAWKFPKHLVDPIMFHHTSAGSVRSVAPTRVHEILRLGLANRLAHAMLLGNSGNETVYPTEEHCRALKISATTIRSIEETARQQTDDTKFALLSSTSSSAWPRRLEQVRNLLSSPFRPVYVSAAPEIDAYRIFCGELAGATGDEPPNLAVVHITAAKERGEVIERLIDAEREARVDGLPILILSPGGQFALGDNATVGRKFHALSTPTPVSRIISALNALLVADAVRKAA